MGAVGTASDSVIFPNLINEMLGTKFKPITGYAGSSQIHLAMEREEVMGRGGNSWVSVQTANMSWITEKKINILIQVGLEKEPELPNVPLLLDLVKGDDAAVVKLVSLPTALGYGQNADDDIYADVDMSRSFDYTRGSNISATGC